MSLVLADRVQETTSTTGTGTLNLAGAATQCQSFISGIGDSNQTYYTIIAGNGTDWEVGLGTVTSGSPNTLSRDVILASSNSNAAVSLTGTSTVFADAPAQLLATGPIVKPPALSNWTQKNISSPASVADSALGPVIIDDFGTGPRVRALLMSAPSTPYTIDALVSADIVGTNYAGAGICFSDGTKYEAWEFVVDQNGPWPGRMRVIDYTNVTTYDADPTTAQTWYYTPTHLWLRMKNDGTNISYYHSADGINWNLRFTQTISGSFLSSSYTYVGFLLDAEGTAESGTTQVCSITLRSWYVH